MYDLGDVVKVKNKDGKFLFLIVKDFNSHYVGYSLDKGYKKGESGILLTAKLKTVTNETGEVLKTILKKDKRFENVLTFWYGRVQKKDIIKTMSLKDKEKLLFRERYV